MPATCASKMIEVHWFGVYTNGLHTPAVMSCLTDGVSKIKEVSACLTGRLVSEQTVPVEGSPFPLFTETSTEGNSFFGFGKIMTGILLSS